MPRQFVDESIFQGVKEFLTPRGRMYAESPFGDGTWKVYFRQGDGALKFECVVNTGRGATPRDIYRKWLAAGGASV